MKISQRAGSWFVFGFAVLVLFGFKASSGTSDRVDGRDALGMTESQSLALRKFTTDNEKKVDKLQRSLRTARDDFRKEMLREEYDVSKVRKYHGKITGIQNRLADHYLSHMLQMRKILSYKQFKRFFQFRTAPSSDKRK
ncbi:MAG: Spy/CpxP family protein refolding chaperone [Candidatus Marinamargulisbacteria bacterium]